MASACVNNIPSPTTPATSYNTFSWLSPRLSLSTHEDFTISSSDLQDNTPDFEFRLGDNATMLPADQLISDGKLVPLRFSSYSSSVKAAPPPPSTPPEKSLACKSISADPYLFSPKAPRCSSRWRELLGLKKLNQTNSQQQPKTASSTPSSTSNNNSKTMRLFLNRNSKTTTSSSSSTTVDSSLSLPLLKDSCSSSLDFESISRLSLSSSSSGHDHDDLPRASLDGEKPRSGPKLRTRPRMENPRVGRSQIRKESKNRGVSVDSPRMNPSGKVVFQSLERSSSSPSSFNNGGPGQRYNKNRGVMERSYSANVHVRITPVLNVPVCSSLRGSSKSGVFGFGNLFSSSHSLKKEGNNNNANTSRSNYHHHQHHSISRNKKDDDKEKEKEKKSS